jgi:cell division protease FtsH
MFLPTEDRHLMTRSQTMAKIAMALGGRVAEEEVFNEITTGASDDIKRATGLARAMVCELGMRAAGRASPRRSWPDSWR